MPLTHFLPAKAQQLLGLFQIELFRTLRGWRWRTFIGSCLIGAYWFGRTASFGSGSLVWFPASLSGINLFTIFFGICGVVFGTEILGQWLRLGGSDFLQGRMNHPLAFFVSRSLAAFCAMVPPIALVVFWPVIGAWRAGFSVLWMPNVLYLITTAFPISLAGIASGAFCRALIPKEIPSLITGFLLITPLMTFRLWGAPANELFLFASASFGILIPTETLIRETLTCYAYSVPFLGAAILTIPSPTPKATKAKKGFFRLSAPTPTWIIRHFILQAKHAGIIRLLLAAVLISTVLLPYQTITKTFDRPDLNIDWYYAQLQPDTNDSMIMPMKITKREIEIEKGQQDLPTQLKLSLSCHPTTASQSLTAFYFGPYTQCISVSSKQREISINRLKTVFPGKDSPVVIRMDPPNDNLEQPIELNFRLAPYPSSERKWELAWHPLFHRFSFLGAWYGESVFIDFPNHQSLTLAQAAPYTITIPNSDELGWLSGSATIDQTDNTTIINQPAPGFPNQLIAANLHKTSPGDKETYPPIDLYFQENRDELAKNFYDAFREPLIQIKRLFGDPRHRLIVYEVPELAPTANLAMSSAQLDRMEVVLPDFDKYEGYTSYWGHRWGGQMNSAKRVFYSAFQRLHLGLVQEIISTNYDGFEHPALLKDGLSYYIHRYALDRGQQFDLRKQTQRDLVLTPWLYARGYNGYPFDVNSKEERKKWLQPLPELKDPKELAQNDFKRESAFFHLLRGMLGDEAFRTAIFNLSQNHQGEFLTVETVQREMEKASKMDLTETFEQWIHQGVLPEFELQLAQAYLYQNDESGTFEYRVEVTAKNIGTGRVEVPWRLETEGEPLKGKEWMDPGEETMFRIVTNDRPVLFELDPAGWVPQMNSNKNGHPKVFFKTITEL